VAGPGGRRGAAILDGDIAARLSEGVRFTLGSVAGRDVDCTLAMLEPGGGGGYATFEGSE